MCNTENIETELKEEQDKKKDKKHRFNFAAFIMPQFWGIGNKVYLGLLALIPILYPFIGIYLGINGTKLAYENSYETSEKFYQKQRRWQYVAIVYVVAIIALLFGVMFDDFKCYFTNKAEINRLIEKTLVEKEILEQNVEILTAEEYVDAFMDGIIAEPLVELDYTESGLWALQNGYDFADLSKHELTFEEPVIFWIHQCFALDDGRILWLSFKVEDNQRIVEAQYDIVPSGEITSLAVEDSLDSGYILESGTYMDESEIVSILGITDIMTETTSPGEAIKEASETESTEEEMKLYLPDENGYYILSSDDSLESIELMMPDGFEMYEFADEYFFNCTDMDIENGVTNIDGWIDKNDAENESGSMIQQVELTLALNNFSSQEIGEVQEKQIGDYEISFFNYSYMTAEGRCDEGYRVWTSLEDNYFLCFSIEKADVDVKELDIEYYLETIFSDIHANVRIPETEN